MIRVRFWTSRGMSGSNRSAGPCSHCRRLIVRWWCCAICMNWTTPRLPRRSIVRLEPYGPVCTGRARCWPRRCGPKRGLRYMNDNDLKLMEGLRELAADGPREAPAFVEEKLLGELH